MASIVEATQQYINSSGQLNISIGRILAAMRPWPLPVSPIPVMPSPNAPASAVLTKAKGASAVAVATAGSGYTVGDVLTLAGTTGPVACKLKVATVNGSGGVTGISIQVPGVMSATPTNPASVTGGTGTGATFTMTYNAGSASSISGLATTWARSNSVFRYWGYSISDIVSGYYGNGVGNGTQCIVEFNSDAPLLDFRFIGANSIYDLYVDDQRISATPVQTDTSGAPYIYTVDWNGVYKTRKYRLVGVNTGFGGVITGSQYSIWFPAELRRPRVWQLGDSYTFGIGATQASFNDFRVMCDALGLEGIADGIGGSGWTSTGSTQPQQRAQAKLSTITYAPDYIFLSLGYNDAPGGNITLLQTNFNATIPVLKTLCPKARIIVIGPATPLGATTQISAVRTAMMDLCTQYGLPFVDVNNWVNASNKQLYTSGDNVHPSNDGHMFRGARLAQAIQQYL